MQFANDCAPRYSYCFAEEGKNSKVAELAKKANNSQSLAHTVMLMHELWWVATTFTPSKLLTICLADRIAKLFYMGRLFS